MPEGITMGGDIFFKLHITDTILNTNVLFVYLLDFYTFYSNYSFEIQFFYFSKMFVEV